MLKWYARANADRKFVQFLEPASSYEVFLKICFAVKSSRKGMNRRGGERFEEPFCIKKGLFLLKSDVALIF